METRELHQPAVIVVSGLPRSGTSMMMQMLQAGGVPILADDLRRQDADNPQGYFEFERSKKLPEGDTGWVAEGSGKAVKVVSLLLPHLPATGRYRVLFLQRELSEVLRSQRTMLQRRQQEDAIPDEQLRHLYEKHLHSIRNWLAAQPNFAVLYVSYNEVLADPCPPIARINAFLGGFLAERAMADAVTPALYRNRT